MGHCGSAGRPGEFAPWDARRRSGKFAPPAARFYAAELLLALEHVHDHAVVSGGGAVSRYRAQQWKWTGGYEDTSVYVAVILSIDLYTIY